MRARPRLRFPWTGRAAVRCRGNCTCLILSTRAALAIFWCTGAPRTPRTHLKKEIDSFRQCSDCDDNRDKKLRVKVEEMKPKFPGRL